MTTKKPEQNNPAGNPTEPDENLQKQTEKALRESEERYRDLVENATDLICTHDLKGTLLSVNAAAARDIGLKVEEIVGLSLLDMLPEDRRHEFNEYIKTILRDGTAAGTMKIVTSNGEARFLEYHNTLRTESVEEPIVRGMARDVTNEVLAKRALKKSEKRYRQLFERNLAGVYRTTIDGRILDCNDAFARIYSYDSRDEAMQHPVMDFHISPEARQEFIAALQAKGMLLDFESRGLRKDGSLIWLLENASLVPGEENGLAEIEGTLIDITERKRAEKELRNSEEIFRQFMDKSPIYVFFKDENIRAIRLSRNYEKMLGRPIDELLGKNMYDLFPSDLAKSMVEDDMRILNEGKPINVEEELNGRFYSTIKFPIYIEGKPRYLAGFTIDITDRKRTEEELLKADKLESVGILAGGIAHDFNNILTAIIGNISLARMNVKPGSKEFDLLNAAETAAMKASGLTGQLLTFAKGGAPTKETISISNLIKETPLYMLKGSKSKCELSITGDLWPVEADAGQIIQVINNIVINADQAMPDSGIIRITAENMVLYEKSEMPLKPGRYIHVSVKDEGVGIAENHLSKIFDPYFSTKQTGSGLGLATAYSIIKKHNGHISVDSSPGAGTTFDIYLPASDKTVPVLEEAAILTGRGKILLMDDDRMLREIAEAMLEILGYESEFAKDGAESIELYRKAKESEKPYDAVILDLTIPGGMGGKEAVEKILELDPQLKAIVCSGYSDGPVMSNYREYGFIGKIAKPFDLNTLGKALNEVLKGGHEAEGKNRGSQIADRESNNEPLKTINE